MNFKLSEDQASVMNGLEQLLASVPSAPSGRPVTVDYSPELDRTLRESGFVSIAGEAGFGPLDAALVIERIARLPQAVEVAGSALLAPLISGLSVDSPISIAEGDPGQAIRYLPMAGALIVLEDDNARLAIIDAQTVEPVRTLLAYPYGRLREPYTLRSREIGNAGEFRRRWRIGLAAEAAGCMQAALALVLDYVKLRNAFGKPLASFQAIQHRLAMAAETAESAKWLAMRAAWSDGDLDAAVAAGFVQSRIAKFTYDLHQFSGAMGLTLEFPLHLWTYRLRAMAGELGGTSRQARAVAAQAWG